MAAGSPSLGWDGGAVESVTGVKYLELPVTGWTFIDDFLSEQTKHLIDMYHVNVTLDEAEYQSLRASHKKYGCSDEAKATRLVRWAIELVCIAEAANEK